MGENVLSIVRIIKNIKEIHEKDILLIKQGSFYHSYGRDAYIISYLFDYKLKNVTDGLSECGFPKNILPRILAKLENKKINYILLNRANNYEVEDSCDNGNLNRYIEEYERAKKYINYKIRIDRLHNFLIDNINLNEKIVKKILKEVEIIINEE